MRLELHTCSFSDEKMAFLHKSLDEPEAPALIRDLADGAYGQMREESRGFRVQRSEARRIHDILLQSINNVMDALLASRAFRNRTGGPGSRSPWWVAACCSASSWTEGY